MSITFRRTLFGIFIALFVIIGIGTIYYSQGYRFDFSTFSIKKTGAIYVETSPKGVQILIGDNSYQDKSGIFQGGTLISNIIPKRYRVVIKKDGYLDYEKNIEVFPSQVVRILNVHLVPNKIQPKWSASDIKGDSVVDISDSGKILTLDAKTGTYYVFDPNQNQSPQTNISSKIALVTKQKIVGLLFYPQSDTSFIVSTSKGVYRADVNTKSLALIQSGGPVLMKSERNNLYMLTPAISSSPKITSTSTNIETFDLVLNSQISEFQVPFSLSSIKDFDTGNDSVAILLNNGALWLCDYSGNPITQVAYLAKQMQFSYDKTKLMYQDSDGKTFVYLMNDDIASLNSIKGQSIRLELINSQNIQSVWWFSDSFHLILKYPDKIVLAEVTSSEPNNHSNLIQNKSATFYDASSKSLYIFSDGIITLYDIGSL